MVSSDSVRMISAFAFRLALAYLLVTQVQGWAAVGLAIVLLYPQAVSSLLRRTREVKGGGFEGRFDPEDEA